MEGETHERSSYRADQFVFFIADEAPLVMGRAFDARVTRAGPGQEILMYGFTPANGGIREGTVSQSVQTYGGGAFTPDYL